MGHFLCRKVEHLSFGKWETYPLEKGTLILWKIRHLSFGKYDTSGGKKVTYPRGKKVTYPRGNGAHILLKKGHLSAGKGGTYPLDNKNFLANGT